jgi:sialidase-1
VVAAEIRRCPRRADLHGQHRAAHQAPNDDENRIVFANPDNLERADGKAKPGDKRDRKNLSIRLSYDEGQSWPVNKPLEPGYSAYSDLAVLPDKTILCIYERGRPGDKSKKPTSYAGLTVARFNLQWLSDGRDSVRQSP